MARQTKYSKVLHGMVAAALLSACGEATEDGPYITKHGAELWLTAEYDPSQVEHILDLTIAAYSPEDAGWLQGLAIVIDDPATQPRLEHPDFPGHYDQDERSLWAGSTDDCLGKTALPHELMHAYLDSTIAGPDFDHDTPLLWREHCEVELAPGSSTMVATCEPATVGTLKKQVINQFCN